MAGYHPTQHKSSRLSLSLLALVVLALAGCDGQSTGTVREEVVRPVKIAVASRIGGARFKSFPGVTEAAVRSTLTFRVSGLVEALPVKAGQRIAKGGLIAQIDATPYRNVVSDREAKFQLAKAQYDRQEVLFGKKLIAKSRLDEVEATLKASRAALDIAREDLEHTSLRAPYDGVIAKVHIDNHQNVQANAPVVEMQGAKNIDIVFNLPEYILLRARHKKEENPPFKVRFNTAPERVFTAYYRKHDAVPDAATRSYRIVLEMPLPKDLLVLPGMSVTVEADMTGIEEPGIGNDVLIPVEALFEKDGKSYVWLVDENNVSRRQQVSARRIEGASVRIADGLKPGQRLVAAGVSQVYEGLKVRELQKERGL